MDNTINTRSAKELFEDAAVKQRFTEMLGNKAQGFITSVISVVNGSPMLQSADKNSLLFAAANAASMDLPINPNLGFAYIVPYKTHGKVLAQFQMGYKGYKQLAIRSGQFLRIECEAVYKSDTEEDVIKRVKSLFTKNKPTGEVVGYIAYFQLINGFEKALFMSIEELKAHGVKYSQSYKYDKKENKTASLWSTDFDSMAKKTVTKLLLSKDAPLSIDMQRAVYSDQSVIKSWDAEELEHIDNQKRLSLSENNEQKERERLELWIKQSKTLEDLAQANDAVYKTGDSELISKYEKKLETLTVNTLSDEIL